MRFFVRKGSLLFFSFPPALLLEIVVAGVSSEDCRHCHFKRRKRSAKRASFRIDLVEVTVQQHSPSHHHQVHLLRCYLFPGGANSINKTDAADVMGNGRVGAGKKKKENICATISKVSGVFFAGMQFTTRHKNSLTKGGRNEVVFTRIHFREIAYRQTVLISRDALTHNKRRRRRTQVQLLGGRSSPKRSRAKDLVAKNRAEGKSFVVCRPPLSTQQILVQLLPSPPNPQKGSSRVVGELVGGRKTENQAKESPVFSAHRKNPAK